MRRDWLFRLRLSDLWEANAVSHSFLPQEHADLREALYKHDAEREITSTQRTGASTSGVWMTWCHENRAA